MKRRALVGVFLFALGLAAGYVSAPLLATTTTQPAAATVEPTANPEVVNRNRLKRFCRALFEPENVKELRENGYANVNECVTVETWNERKHFQRYLDEQRERSERAEKGAGK